MLLVLAVEWFRSGSYKTKRALIYDGPPFKYTEEDRSKNGKPTYTIHHTHSGTGKPRCYATRLKTL